MTAVMEQKRVDDLPHDLETIEAILDGEIPEPKEDDSDLAIVDFPRPILERYITRKAALKDLEAEQDADGELIRRQAEPLRLSVSQAQGALVRSVLLGGMLRYTAQNRFGKIKPGRGDVLARKFNGQFSKCFRDVKEYELDRSALAKQAADPEVAAAFVLLRKAGVLTQSRYYKPTEALFLQMTLDADFRALCVSEGIAPVSMLCLPKSISAR